MEPDGSFNAAAFEKWIEATKHICEESGHLEVALSQIGKVLANPKLEHLWLNPSVAKFLDDKERDDMRRGFHTGVINSRGAHMVDPTGKPEMELASKYKSKAEEVENAGYLRFAITFRELAESYEREAERNRSDYGRED